MAKILGNIILRQTLITYNLTALPTHDKIAVRLNDLMKAKGYQDWLSGVNSKGEAGKIYLPDNTLCKANTTPKDAKADLRDAARFCGAEITCCIAADVQEWSGMSCKAPNVVYRSEQPKGSFSDEHK